MDTEEIKREMELNDVQYQKEFRRNSKKLQIAEYSQSLPSGVKKFIRFGFANLDLMTFPEILDEYKKLNENNNKRISS